MIHPYNESQTHRFASLINDRSYVTEDIQSFILVDDNYTREAGFDSGIRNNVSISSVNTISGNHLKNLIQS